MAMDVAVHLEKHAASGRSAFFDNLGFAHTLANCFDAARTAASKSRKKSRLPDSHYPGPPLDTSIPRLQESRNPRRPYIPPREHPWRRFRLPGSPP
jgi:hypothetical protein